MDHADAHPLAQPRGRSQAEDCPEKVLIAACLRGEAWASEALYHRFKRRVYALVLRIAGPADADEITQEAFVRIFRGLAGFRGEASLSTWVYRLSVNVALSHVGRAPKPPSDEAALERVAAPVPPQRDPKLQARLEAALLELPAGYRTVLVLHDIHGFSHEECAEVLKCRVGTSKSQLHKARARMRELLGPILGKREDNE